MLKKSFGLSCYDIKKISSNKIFWITLFAISFLYLGIAFIMGNYNGFSNETYRELKKFVQSYDSDALGLPYENGMEYVVSTYDEMAMAKERGSQLPEPVWTESSEEEYRLFLYVRQDIDGVYSYEDFLNSVKDNGNVISEISIFADAAGDFSKNNIHKTMADYDRLSADGMEYTGSRGLCELINSDIYPVMAFIFIFVIVMLLTIEERNHSYNRLFNTMKNGRGVLAFSKLLTVAVYSFFITALMLIFTLLASFVQYGFVKMNVPVQALYGFSRSELHMSVGGMLFMLLLLRWLLTFFTGVILLLITNYVFSIPSYTIAGIMVYVIGIVMDRVPGHSMTALFRYINIPYMLNASGFIAEYCNLDFLSKPISFKLAAAVVVVIAVVISMIIFCRGFSAANMKSVVGANDKHKKRKERKPKNEIKHGLLFYEMYKQLIGRRIVIAFFAAIICVSAYLIFTYEEPSFNENYYIRYMQSFEGKLDDERVAVIEKEAKRLDTELSSLKVLGFRYNNGDISFEQFNSDYNRHEIASLGIGGFQMLEDRLKYVLSREEADNWLVFDNGWRLALGIDDFKEKGMILFMISEICLVVACSGIFSMEDEYGMGSILGTCKNGTDSLKRAKQLSGVCMALFSMLAVNIPIYIFCEVKYKLNCLSAPANSIPALSKIGGGISLLEVLAVNIVIKLIVLTAVSYVIMYVSEKQKSTSKTFILGIMMFVMPIACMIFI